MMRPITLLFSVLALAGAAPTAFAAVPGQAYAVSAFQAQISAREARNIAERAHPRASVLHVRFVDGGRPYYEVRMIEGGSRFDVRVDARTGRIL